MPIKILSDGWRVAYAQIEYFIKEVENSKSSKYNLVAENTRTEL